jgi:hypothetical protein
MTLGGPADRAFNRHGRRQIGRYGTPRPLTHEDESGGKVAPDHGALDGMEIMAKEVFEVETPHLAILHLQAVDILVLGEDAVLIKKIADFAEKSLALGGWHEAQGEGRNHGVHAIMAVAMNFGAKGFRASVDDFEARIGNIGFQIMGKARIDFESKQGGFEWDHFEQGARHHASAGSNLHNDARPFERQRANHGFGKVSRAWSDRANGAKVGENFLGKCLQIGLRKASVQKRNESPPQRRRNGGESTSHGAARK